MKSRLVIPPLILAVAWCQELIDQLVFGGRWNLPMLPGGPWSGVLTAPFSHGDLNHLLANSLLFLPLSWLVLLRGQRDYLAVWLGVYAAAIPVWLLWPVGSHGLSGVVYGLLGYLLLIGWLEKRPLSLAALGAVPGELRRGAPQPAAAVLPARRELDRACERLRRRPAGGLGGAAGTLTAAQWRR